MTTESTTINGTQAATIYTALGHAITRVEQQLKLKSADMFKDAIALQIAAYRAERQRLAEVFPTLAG